MALLYRPEENSVGILYNCWGRFSGFVGPNQWVFVPPVFFHVQREMRMNMRTLHVTLADVLSKDAVILSAEIDVSYYVDLRKTEPENRIQVLHFENDRKWEEMLKTMAIDIARNEIFISRTFKEMTTRDGREYLKNGLGSILSTRAREYGIIVHPRNGVNIVNLQPNEEHQKAMRERSAAEAFGTAAVERLQPLLAQIGDSDQRQALGALLLQFASAVAKNGQLPSVLGNMETLDSGAFSFSGQSYRESDALESFPRELADSLRLVYARSNRRKSHNFSSLGQD